jgi:SAM-dependent methyltransferase
VTHANISPEAKARLLSLWRREEQQPFHGWDFVYLSGRLSDEQPPWSYALRAAELLRGASSVVDLGTGGGERLLELRDAWPARVTATEEHPPNFQLATDRLAPLGVRVASVRLTEIDSLPFDDAEFDVVLNRHSAFNCAEVARVLAPGGTFLTQQVHGRSAEVLQAAFGAEPLWPDASPDRYVPRLAEAGLDMVNVLTWTGHVTFTDVGALVYYLRAVPWIVPGFSVATHQESLLRLHQRLDAGQAALTFPTRLYLIEAKRGLANTRTRGGSSPKATTASPRPTPSGHRCFASVAGTSPC